MRILLRSRSARGAVLAAVVLSTVPGQARAEAISAAPAAAGIQPAEFARLVAARPADFGGAYLDPASGGLVVQVHRGARAGAARAALAALTATRRAARPLTVTTVEHSYAELAALRDRVPRAAPWAAAAAPVLAEWGVDVVHNRVAIGVTAVTPRLRALARATFGPAVELHRVERSRRASRVSDTAPWSGGGVITTDLGSCTSGFAVQDTITGLIGMVTAGHCATAGSTISNNGVPQGVVIQRDLSDGGRDYAIYTGSTYLNRIYTGPVDSGETRMISGLELIVLVGQTGLCFVGAARGASCDTVVTEVDVCVRFTDDVTTCGLNRAANTADVPLTRPGDSGGPVYLRHGAIGGVSETDTAVGIIVGSRGNTSVFHQVGAVLPLGYAVLVIP